MSTTTTATVTAVPAAPPATAAAAEAHFAGLLAHETDCWDVHAAGPDRDFAVIDVRHPDDYAAGHVPGAVNLTVGRLVGRNLAAWPADTLLVVYCAGPHCNGADRAALVLARLGRPVKKMIGGVTGWLDEGLTLATD
jgi:rhodanese-related sulfurtransferase